MLKLISYNSPGACEDYIGNWNHLLDKGACKNPFYSPEMLLTAWRCYDNRRLRVKTVWDGDSLVGLLPVVTEFNFSLFPVVHEKAWRYRHCYSCAPLLAKGYETRVLDRLMEDAGGVGRMFSMYDIPLEGALGTTLEDAEATHASTHLGQYKRASLHLSRTGREPFQERIRNKRIREFQRQRRLLRQKGNLEFKAHETAQASSERLEAFMLLEQKGWKGRSRTALISNPSDRQFACTALNMMAENGRLYVYELVLDDNPVAMLLVLNVNGELYTFKITHDPAYDRHSPGVLLMLESSDKWEWEGRVSLVDSCATPDHSMVNRIWYEKRSIGKFHVAGADPYTRALVMLRNLGNSDRAVKGAT